MQRLVDRATQVHERFGLGGLLKEGLDKAVLRPARLDIVHVLALTSGDRRPPSIGPGYELRFLGAEELARFAKDAANQLGPAFVERARGRLDLCFAALHGDRLASYGWCALGSVEAEHAAGVALDLAPDTAYLYKGFTHPDFRGRGLYPACMAGALSALGPRGVDRLIAFVYWSNAAALRSCERIGFGRLGALVVGPRGPLRIPAAARGLGVQFGTHATVALARDSRTQRRRE